MRKKISRLFERNSSWEKTFLISTIKSPKFEKIFILTSKLKFVKKFNSTKTLKKKYLNLEKKFVFWKNFKLKIKFFIAVLYF